MRCFQVIIFCLGIMILCLVDTVMILTCMVPNRFALQNVPDYLAWLILYGIYLVFMLIAMFPGFEELPEQLEFD